MCSICGGPEVITAKDSDETKLLLPKAAWELFIAIAQIAADHFPVAVRAEIIQCLQRSKAQIVDPNDDVAVPLAMSGVGSVKSLHAAASGRMLSSAAIAARHAAPGAHVDARRRVMGDPRTLYGRGGGVFGLAKLADNLMEAWMADPVLNANAAVTTWHQSQQKFGFKFLVTQLLGYLTGGPQRYTGVPMDVAHKHLGITGAEWNSFIAVADTVFQKLGVDARTQADLQAILASFKDQCVVKSGETVPEDPGMCRARPQGNQAYAQLGGVYPIALFADRLVDKVLQSDRMQVQWNAQDDPSGERHPPGLKYMITELLCHGAGGPELPTSRGFDDAKLGVDPNQWSDFLQIVAETSAVWPTKHHRDLVMRICENNKVEICFGLEGQQDLDLDLGIAAPSGVAAFAMTSRCPFSGQSGGGKCPFSSGQVGNATSPKRNKTSEVSAIPGAIQNAAQSPMIVRILGNAMQQRLDALLDEDPDLCCPVSLMVFSNPVIASDGFTYEEWALKQLLANRQVSPMTREVLKQTYRPSQSKLVEVTTFRIQRSQELLDFAAEAANEQQRLALAAVERVTEFLEVVSKDSVTVQNLMAKATCIYEQLGRPLPARLTADLPPIPVGSQSEESESIFPHWFQAGFGC
jgi:hypothetical protein